MYKRDIYMRKCIGGSVVEMKRPYTGVDDSRPVQQKKITRAQGGAQTIAPCFAF